MICDKGISYKLGVKGHRLCTLTFATSKMDISISIKFLPNIHLVLISEWYLFGSGTAVSNSTESTGRYKNLICS